LKGEVVGVNSQIYTRTGGSIGLSFAIPISVVNNVVDQLRETGQVVRGWLGVSIQDVDRSLAESFALDRPRGALIVQVQPDGPAAKAGLESGDVILRFDGAEIGSSAELPHVVGLIAPGTKAKVDIIRKRKARTITVEVGGLEARQQASVAGVIAGGDPLGLVVDEADAQTLQRWSLTSGVVVTEVMAGGPAEEANVMPGDVITMVDGTPVTSVETYRRALEKLEPGVSVPVRLIHRGTPRFIGIRPTQ
jgi:serine protease Do